MATITVPNFRDGYIDLVKSVASWGRVVSPRGMRTYELPATTVVLGNPYDALPLGTGRGVRPAIAAAEALQLVAGRSYPNLMTNISNVFGSFLDGGIFHGAYGPRVRPQVPAAVRRLEDDPETRQAVVVLWDPLHDLMTDSRDVPCTVSLTFHLRINRLELHSHMRSNDVWLGAAYDLFQFSELQIAVARRLGVEVGQLYHHAESMHLYERDLHKVDGLVRNTDVEPPPRGVGRAGMSWERIRRRADKILCGGTLDDETEGETWLRTVLRGTIAGTR